MSNQDRTSLKGFFETGDVPTEQQFADLIESQLNRKDDDIDRAVSSMADLVNGTIVNTSALTDGATVLVHNFYSDAEGGGGLFYWDVNEPKSNHNGGTIINPDHQATSVGNGDWYSSTGNGTDDTGNGCFKGNPYNRINIEEFGAVADNTTDYATAIQAAIDYIHSIGGGEIYFNNTSNWILGSKIVLKDRVSLIGTGRSGEIEAGSSFPDTSMIECLNDTGSTSSMFHSYIKNITLNGNSEANLREIVLARAWQENSGFKNVLIRGFSDRGVTIQDGYGGAAYLKFEDIEMFPGANANYGIYVDEISTVSSFVLHIDGATIAGGASKSIDKCIYMNNDHLLISGFHTEYAIDGIVLDNSSSLNLKSATGSFNDVTNIVRTLSTWAGDTIKMDTVIRGGATRILQDDANSKGISESFITSYTYSSSYNDFMKSVGVDIADNNFAELPLINDVDSSFLIITINSTSVDDTGLFHIRPDADNQQINIIAQSNTRFIVGTGTPTGTTGTNGNVGIYTGDNDGEIYVENRIGFTVKIQYMLFR